MKGKYIYILIVALLIGIQVNAQFRPERTPSGRPVEGNSGYEQGDENSQDEAGKKKEKKKKPSVPSVIRVWQLDNQGARIKPSELDTALTFYHLYQPFEQRSISNTFTGNNGSAYESNDFFNRTYNSDFYFAHSFDAYWLMPNQIQYFNTTTPYSVLDYTQSENRSQKNETRFNVIHSQNVNKKFNFEFIYNQSKSQGQYARQETKFHSIGLGTSYISDKFLSHSNIIFNRSRAQENGGIVLDPGRTLGDNNTEDFIVRLEGTQNRIQNNNFYTTNEYRLGKTVEADSADYIVNAFIPRVGFIHSFEYSGNRRSFVAEPRDTSFFASTINKALRVDSTTYNRITNIFQIKTYEAPDRKYTFGKRVYIGNDQMWYKFSVPASYFPQKLTNTFVGGGIFRNEGKFWQWEADGRFYMTGYRAGQTELSGSVNKPLRIGRDTTSLRIEGSIKSLKPEYYDQYFYSNHFEWQNNFSNINEVRLGGSIRSQEYKANVGANYALIGNYIYNNEQALPTQASGELMVLSAYANKDFDSRHWLVRTQVLAQKASNEDYIHLPALAGFVSINYRTIWSKVMYTQLGIDTRYNTSFYADAYQPGTARFYLQNQQKIGNYPYVDLHVNMKLKRTRFFFRMMNVGSGLLGNNYFLAPDYPYYRRTFRIGLAWSFYD
ncbi:MAG: putative porin [Candidatus Saccharibacteria bacterium]